MSNDNSRHPTHPCVTGTGQWRDQAIDLIKRRRTLVLATGGQGSPWAAAVYYVYVAPGFYFFSSPKAHHVQHIGKTCTAAATVYADSDQWENIQGIQMAGRIEEIAKRIEQINITARYLAKFPFAAKFLSGRQGTRTREMSVEDKVRLYAFMPDSVYYMNNRFGFGRREAIVL